MPLSFQTLPTTTIADIEQSIADAENNPWDLVSLAQGKVGGAPGNMAVFISRDPHNPQPSAIVLKVIDGNLTRDKQRDALNALDKKLVCYTSLFISGTLENVAVLRG